ncbi:sugar ABC transporter permease [Vallitalea longa]|uniref:Sugar ABC transporter permease n=1 Tax=Vallitalea longa TaxID=2936439 RepID=A0A9W5Y8X2_9FIRM|nr:extracellular solute-binding protein [Vallitalea longa]GKX29407.1 sugar ABC transporter permease [Vallitalea longa]
MKKILSIVLIASIIMTFTGCGKKDDSKSSSNSGTSNNIVYDGEFGKIVDEPVDLRIHLSQEDKDVLTSDMPIVKYLSEATGINIIGSANPGAGDSAGAFNLQAADGFPDDIYAGNELGSMFMQFGSEGAFVPINEYLDKMPNFSAFLESDLRVKASITAPDGNIYYIPYMQPDMTASKAYFIRKDWLDKYELKTPSTVTELEETLLDIIDSDPNGNGQEDEFGFFARKPEEIVRLANLFGARVYGNDNDSERYIPTEDGKLYHAWLQPEFKDAIKNVSRWYDLGIIDNEYITNPESRRDHYLLNNLGAMTYDWIASTSGYNERKNVVEGFEFIPMAPPENSNGKKVNEHVRPIITSSGWAISSKCKNIDVAIALFDTMFTEYGRTIANFGVEGEQWEYVDDVPTFMDDVLNNDEGKPVNLYLRDNVGAQLFMGFKQDYEYERQWTSDWGLKGIEIYGTGEYDVPTLPALVFTNEEFDILNKYLTNINSFIDESVHSWIIRPYEELTNEVWDEYLSQVEKLGIEQVTKAYQDAYSRYIEIMK